MEELSKKEIERSYFRSQLKYLQLVTVSFGLMEVFEDSAL